MKARVLGLSIAAAVAANGAAFAQEPAGTGPFLSPTSIVLLDSTGAIAARALSETIMLVKLDNGIVAPALIRPAYEAGGRAMSGLAIWQSGGGVLFASSDCSLDAYVYSLPQPGVRAAAQVQTPAGIVLYVGAIGTASTVAVRSILYDTGCVQVSVRQDGLHPVVATLNLSAAYPAPLSLQ
jgi:hypothetical protein